MGGVCPCLAAPERPRACGAGKPGRAGAHPVLPFRVVPVSFFLLLFRLPLLLLSLFLLFS